ncbi:RimK family alpha-L-glutamate ligase [Telluria mixta]|uniref:RimK family alpha-L-glutamate ligase n=1 Tax=Telluria mixta TaxID=34071 RepID=A0ABT2BT17_9BURK|nr:RimK family alpha-L-glutamate ligase [Telluria mixta]MCS0628263.1 RimK family alpha-L-glutamate ligase [Telluria mixta]WEM93625.1 RimK family alpha-L-glutamate ligase [Telluria mixta]
MITPALIDAAATPYAPLIGAAALMRCAFDRADLRPVGERLLARAQAHPDDANAWLDASFVLQLLGQRAAGLEVQRHALAIRSLYALPAPARVPTLRLLVLMGPGDFMANTPIEFLLQTSNAAAHVQYVTPDLPLPEQVPDHDVLFVAIAQSDANGPLLRDVAQMLAGWPRPVINRPERIAHLSRDGVCAMLDGVTGMLVPRTVRLDRARAMQLTDAAFPLIVRPVDSHAGTDLQKVDDAAALGAYLAAHAAGEFFLAPFVDYSGPDGQFRKYRIVLVDGKPFICHLAISSHWMVHYLNAGMDDSAGKRAEEAAGMAAFDEGFARRHAAALADIDARIGLPWLGIDCAETRDGRLLIFEVDNAMVVHAMDDAGRYPYKGPVMDRVFGAFEGMLHRAAGQAEA